MVPKNTAVVEQMIGIKGPSWRGGTVGGLRVVVALMQVCVEDPDVLLGLAAVVQVVPVVVVAAAHRNRLPSPAGGGRLQRSVVVVAAGGGGSSLLPPAAGDREMRPAARAGAPLGALGGAGRNDGRLQGDTQEGGGGGLSVQCNRSTDILLTHRPYWPPLISR